MPRKRTKQPKKHSATYWRKKCVTWAKLEAKERDNFICQKCGKKVEGMNAHGSHIYNEGTYRSMSADPDNILTMCYYCHINWWHKNPISAAAWMWEKYPELTEKLRKRSQIIKVIDWKKRWEEIINRYTPIKQNV